MPDGKPTELAATDMRVPPEPDPLYLILACTSRKESILPNLISQDEIVAGDIKVLTGGQVAKQLVGTIARTDTAAKTLGTLPAGAIITGIRTYGATASDAATTATISVGKAGGTEYLNTLDVKGGTGTGQQVPTTKATLGSVGTSAVVVTGIYAETGTASTAGGPWTVVLDFVSPTS